MPNNSMTCTFPASAFRSLPKLERIDLANNRLRGKWALAAWWALSLQWRWLQSSCHWQGTMNGRIYSMCYLFVKYHDFCSEKSFILSLYTHHITPNIKMPSAQKTNKRDSPIPCPLYHEALKQEFWRYNDQWVTVCCCAVASPRLQKFSQPHHSYSSSILAAITWQAS